MPRHDRLQRLEAIAAILHVDDLAVAQAKDLEQLGRVATVRSAPLEANLRDRRRFARPAVLGDPRSRPERCPARGAGGPTGPPQGRVNSACGATTGVRLSRLATRGSRRATPPQRFDISANGSVEGGLDALSVTRHRSSSSCICTYSRSVGRDRSARRVTGTRRALLYEALGKVAKAGDRQRRQVPVRARHGFLDAAVHLSFEAAPSCSCLTNTISPTRAAARPTSSPGEPDYRPICREPLPRRGAGWAGYGRRRAARIRNRAPASIRSPAKSNQGQASAGRRCSTGNRTPAWLHRLTVPWEWGGWGLLAVKNAYFRGCQPASTRRWAWRSQAPATMARAAMATNTAWS